MCWQVARQNELSVEIPIIQGGEGKRKRIVASSFSTLKMEVIRSTESLVHVRTTRRYIPECGNNNYCENLISYLHKRREL
jgi:hypothetical protein